MKLQNWVKLPTAWIEAGGLKAFTWGKDTGSAGISALMVLPVIAHYADIASGHAILTYDALTLCTGLSRTKVAHGLSVLKEREVIRANGGRSGYQLIGFDPNRNWGKLPARALYAGDAIAAFQDFHLRRRSELDALKAYFAIVARRDTETNQAHITYDKFQDYAGILRERIKSAISLLAAHGLIYIDHVPSKVSEFGVASAYRLAHLDSYVHQGTRGRVAAAGSMTGS